MPATDTRDAEVAAPKGKFAKLKIPLVIAAVVLLEFVVVYMFFPPAAAEAPPPEPVKEAAKELPPPPPELEEPLKLTQSDKEVDLGDFSVTAHQALANVTLRIDFHLFGTVPIERDEEFTKAMESRGKRVREQVSWVIRAADLTDLTDAGLGLIKRRILATTNKTLGKPLMTSIVFTDFRFNEQ